MSFQMVFKRYELKYILTQSQKEQIVKAMAPYMKLDEYGRTTIRNVYYDTDDYRLIRKSIEQPVYKEKLRVRSYKQATGGSTVFVELKKKYQSVVYKRRLALAENEAVDWLNRDTPCPVSSQISNEIDYCLDYYESLHPVAFISYEREAYYALDESDFRVTFDDTILFRDHDITLEAPVGGEHILPKGLVLMEIKCSGGIPLWMTELLSKYGISKTSYSKYGSAYRNLIFQKMENKTMEEIRYV